MKDWIVFSPVGVSRRGLQRLIKQTQESLCEETPAGVEKELAETKKELNQCLKELGLS